MSYKNPEKTIHERVEDLMSRMTLEEKVGQVNQHLYGWKAYEKEQGFRLTDYFKEHVQWGQGMGALYGLFRADPWSKVNHVNGVPAEESWKLANEVQDYVINHSRLGIPVLLAEECPHGHQGLDSISYPTNIGKGNSFNRTLVEETSRHMAEELAMKGVHLALVSSLDLSRDPRWGRTEECYGEDPYLAAAFNHSIISGFQGNMINDHRSFVHQTVEEIGRRPEQIGVVLKHCIAQGDGLGGHNSGAVNIGDREFMEIYYPLLKSAKNAVGIMAAYNDIDGVPCHTNHQLFQELLRKKIGYQGVVMADGTALDRLKPIYGSNEKAAGKALQAGIDLSLWDETYLTIGKGVKQGDVQMAALDASVYRLLSIKFMLGLFDRPYTEKPEASHKERMYSYQKMNQQLAAESMTLLKNDGVLPLADSGEQLAVIGPNAHALYNQLGDYTAPQSEEAMERTIAASIKQAFPKSKVSYEKGCDIRDVMHQEVMMEKAVELAEKSDKIILVLGGSSARKFDMEFFANGAVSSKGVNMDSGENVDVASLALGGRQMELFERLSRVGKPIVTILIQGRPHEIDVVRQQSAAVIAAWYPGQEGGPVLAQLLTGEISPSGKLSISYPRSSGQLPVYHYQRDITMNENYYDQSGAPLYSFGFGKSYTEICYETITVLNPKITKEDLKNGQKLQLEVKLKNQGQSAVKEAVLLFIKLHGGDVIQRKQLLRGFDKIEVQPSETRKVRFELGVDELCYFSSQKDFELTDEITIKIQDLEESVCLKDS